MSSLGWGDGAGYEKYNSMQPLDGFMCVYEALFSVHSCLIYKALTEKNDEMLLVPPRAPVFGEGTEMWTPNDSMRQHAL